MAWAQRKDAAMHPERTATDSAPQAAATTPLFGGPLDPFAPLPPSPFITEPFPLFLSPGPAHQALAPGAAAVQAMLCAGPSADHAGAAERLGDLASSLVPPVSAATPVPGTLNALWVAITARYRVVAQDPARPAVELERIADGRQFSLRLDSASAFQRDALPHEGDVNSWAERLLGLDADGRPQAAGKDIMRVLRDMVPQTPSTESSAPGVEEEREDAATRLCRAALFGPIHDRVGGFDGGLGAFTRQTTIAYEEGRFFHHAGVGLKTRDGRTHLYLNLQTAIVGALRDSEFGSRVRATPARLARILNGSPRLISSHCGIREARRGRWWDLDVTDLVTACPHDDATDDGMEAEVEDSATLRQLATPAAAPVAPSHASHVSGSEPDHVFNVEETWERLFGSRPSPGEGCVP